MSVLNPTFFSKKKSAILSSCVPITIFVGFALSIGLSVSYINSNYLLSNQYEDNNKVRIALDLTHKTVDPFDTSYDFWNETEQTITSNVQKSVSAISRYFEYEKLETYNLVEFAGFGEYLQHGEETLPSVAYIDMVLPSEWQQPRDDNGNAITTATKDITIPAINTFFNYFNSNRISFVFDADVSRGGGLAVSSDWNKGYNASASIEQIVVNPSVNIGIPSDSSSKAKTVITMSKNDSKITSTDWHEYTANAFGAANENPDVSSEQNNASLRDFGPQLRDGDDPQEKWEPILYVLRDQETLINRMRFILQAYSAHYNLAADDNDFYGGERANYDEAWKYLSENEKSWANEAMKNRSYLSKNLIYKGTAMNKTMRPSKDFVRLTQWTELDAGDTIEEDNWYYNEYINNNNNYFYRLINKNSMNISSVGLSAEIEYPNKPADGELATVNDWMTPYVIATITKENYKEFFPNGDPFLKTDSVDEANRGKWMVFDRGTSYAANLFKNALNGSFSTVYPVKIMNYGLNDQNSSTAPKGGVINAIKSYYSSSEINSQKIDQLWTNNSSFAPGLFGTINPPFLATLIALVVLLFIIGVFVSVIYRVPGFFGFVGLIAITTLSLLFFVLNSHLISFSTIIGVVIGILMYTFILISLLERNKKHLILRNTTTDSSLKKTLFKSVWPIFDLAIVGIIISGFGIYFGSLAIYQLSLYVLLFSLLLVPFISLWGLLCYYFFNNDYLRNKKTWMSYRKFDELKAVINEENANENKYLTTFSRIKNHHVDQWYFKSRNEWIMTIIGGIVVCGLIIITITLACILHTNLFGGYQSIINSTILYLVYSGLCLSGFALIRLNWTSFATILLSNAIIIASIFWLSYIYPLGLANENVCLISMLFICVNLFLFHFVAHINNFWVRNQFYPYQQMREIIALEIKTAFIHFYTKIITLFVIGGILFACFSPVDVFIMLIVCFLFFPFVCVVVYFCVKTTLPFFMNLRMRYKSTLIHHEYFIDTSLDEFDEQIIEGINRKKVLNISI